MWRHVAQLLVAIVAGYTIGYSTRLGEHAADDRHEDKKSAAVQIHIAVPDGVEVIQHEMEEE